uniref:Uncharacterized protein n=1 Tax=Romanomermis culicivorax TaxID=13658 RepID=A0A915KK85_ROMCU
MYFPKYHLSSRREFWFDKANSSNNCPDFLMFRVFDDDDAGVFAFSFFAFDFSDILFISIDGNTNCRTFATATTVMFRHYLFACRFFSKKPLKRLKIKTICNSATQKNKNPAFITDSLRPDVLPPQGRKLDRSKSYMVQVFFNADCEGSRFKTFRKLQKKRENNYQQNTG